MQAGSENHLESIFKSLEAIKERLSKGQKAATVIKQKGEIVAGRLTDIAEQLIKSCDNYLN